MTRSYNSEKFVKLVTRSDSSDQSMCWVEASPPSCLLWVVSHSWISDTITSVAVFQRQLRVSLISIIWTLVTILDWYYSSRDDESVRTHLFGFGMESPIERHYTSWYWKFDKSNLFQHQFQDQRGRNHLIRVCLFGSTWPLKFHQLLSPITYSRVNWPFFASYILGLVQQSTDRNYSDILCKPHFTVCWFL